MPTLVTRTVKAAGGDYTTLRAAITDVALIKNRNLVTADEAITIEVYGGVVDAAQITAADWGACVTDATRNITITAPAGQRHLGSWAATKWRLSVAKGFGYMLEIPASLDVTLDHLQLENTAAWSMDPGGLSYVPAAGHTGAVDGCIVRQAGAHDALSGDTDAGGIKYGGAGTLRIRNSLIADFLHIFTSDFVSAGETIIYSCTGVGHQVSGNRIGADAGHTLRVKNLILQGIGLGWDPVGAPTLDVAAILTQDASSPTVALRNQVLAFADPNNGNYAIAEGDAAAIDSGVDLSADPHWAFDFDVNSVERAAPWDLGYAVIGAEVPAPAVTLNWAPVARAADRFYPKTSVTAGQLGIDAVPFAVKTTNYSADFMVNAGKWVRFMPGQPFQVDQQSGYLTPSNATVTDDVAPSPWPGVLAGRILFDRSTPSNRSTINLIGSAQRNPTPNDDAGHMTRASHAFAVKANRPEDDGKKLVVYYDNVVSGVKTTVATVTLSVDEWTYCAVADPFGYQDALDSNVYIANHTDEAQTAIDFLLAGDVNYSHDCTQLPETDWWLTCPRHETLGIATQPTHQNCWDWSDNPAPLGGATVVESARVAPDSGNYYDERHTMDVVMPAGASLTTLGRVKIGALDVNTDFTVEGQPGTRPEALMVGLFIEPGNGALPADGDLVFYAEDATTSTRIGGIPLTRDDAVLRRADGAAFYRTRLPLAVNGGIGGAGTEMNWQPYIVNESGAALSFGCYRCYFVEPGAADLRVKGVQGVPHVPKLTLGAPMAATGWFTMLADITQVLTRLEGAMITRHVLPYSIGDSIDLGLNKMDLWQAGPTGSALLSFEGVILPDEGDTGDITIQFKVQNGAGFDEWAVTFHLPAGSDKFPAFTPIDVAVSWKDGAPGRVGFRVGIEDWEWYGDGDDFEGTPVEFSVLTDSADWELSQRLAIGADRDITGMHGGWIQQVATLNEVNPNLVQSQLQALVAVPATQLAITTQPFNAVTGSPFGTQPVIEIRGADGSLVTDSTVEVTAAVSAGATVLSGTVTLAAVGGIVTYADLVATGVGVGNEITFSSPGLASVTSDPFDVRAAPAVAEVTPPEEFDTTRVDADFQGVEWECATPADLTAALAGCADGDKILLQPGAEFVGQFELRDRGTDGWVEIRTNISIAALDTVCPQGSRMTPAKAALLNFAAIRGDQGTGAIRSEPGCRGYRLTAIECTIAEGNPSLNGVIRFGNLDISDDADACSYLWADRCYVHGSLTANVRRGFNLTGMYVAVIDSWLEDFYDSNTDSQPLAAFGYRGPYKIVNNYLDGWSEGFLCGGAESGIAGDNVNGVPSDLVFRRNYVTRKAIYANAFPGGGASKGGGAQKNGFELKCVIRALVEQNIFEHTLAQGQSGFGISIKSDNSGFADHLFSGSQDVEVRNNWVRSIGAGLSLSAVGDGVTPNAVHRVWVHNNLFEEINTQDPWKAAGTVMQWLNNLSDITIDHNTFVKDVNTGGPGVIISGVAASGLIAVRSNVLYRGAFGFKRDGVGEGLASWESYVPNQFDRVWEKNVMIGASAAAYPEGTLFAADDSAVQYSDLAGGLLGYVLDAASPYKAQGHDGADIGVSDVPAFFAALDGVEEGAPAVVAGAATQLDILVEPPSAITGLVMAVQPRIAIEDVNGVVVQDSAAVVTVEVASGPAVLSGNTSVAAVSGVSTFAGLILTGIGLVTLRFTSPGLAQAVTAEFNVTAVPVVPTFLGIITQPGGAVTGFALAIQPVVEIRDENGVRVAGSTAVVTVAVSSGIAGVLGNVTAQAVDGRATFDGLIIAGVGDVTLVFSSPGLADMVSAPFSIAGVIAPPVGNSLAVQGPTRLSRPRLAVKQGDTLPPLVTRLLGADGTAQQLPTGSVVVLSVRAPDGTVVVDRVQCQITDAETGEVRYDWRAGDLAQQGAHTFELEATIPGESGGVLSFPNGGYGELRVVPQLA